MVAPHRVLGLWYKCLKNPASRLLLFNYYEKRGSLSLRLNGTPAYVVLHPGGEFIPWHGAGCQAQIIRS
jgi:hypothetical protein